MDKIEDDEQSEQYIEYDDGRDVQNVTLLWIRLYQKK